MSTLVGGPIEGSRACAPVPSFWSTGTSWPFPRRSAGGETASSRGASEATFRVSFRITLLTLASGEPASPSDASPDPPCRHPARPRSWVDGVSPPVTAGSASLMLGTFTLGRFLGVTVRVHGLVLVLAAFLLVVGGLRGQPVVLPLGALVVALLAHEFGHALVARRLGVQVYDVVLWPLGGMARMGDAPEDARVSAAIAAAGPAVNLALAGLSLALLGLAGEGATVDLPSAAAWRSPAAALQVFLVMNLLLGVGNLLPAFPMDGGRLLRSLLVGLGRSWLAATELAVRVGRWIAVGLLVFGVLRAPVLVLIALFLLFEGTRELWATRLRHGAGPLGGFSFGGLDLREILRARAAAAGAGGAHRTAQRPDSAASQTGGSRPFDADPPAPLREAPPLDGSKRRPGEGFSDDDVRRLESYRGRLRRGLGEREE